MEGNDSGRQENRNDTTLFVSKLLLVRDIGITHVQ